MKNVPIDPIPFIFWTYVVLGPFAWGVLIWATERGRHRMDLLRRHLLPELDPAPALTVLVPAKDEEQRIADCVRSILAQDYPALTMVAIDDRSRDRTGEILDRLAGEDPRLKVVHVREGELPDGWTGKCNALHRGAALAGGEYLAFVDSDVALQPGALRDCVALMHHRQVDLLSLLPRLESGSLMEQVVVPLAGAALTAQLLVPLANQNHRLGNAFANGQVMLFRRSAYQSIGGHSAVRDRFCEDVHFARLLKQGGGKLRICLGEHLASTRMYSSLGAILRGWARIFYATTLGFPWRILLAMLFVTAGLCVYPVLAFGVYRTALGMPEWWIWFVAGGIHLGIISWLVSSIYRWSGNPARNAVIFPLGAVLLLLIYTKALVMCATGRVTWRGTTYSGMSQQHDPARVRAIAADPSANQQPQGPAT